ncbi:MAG: cold shock domain-containing protein [bacterium]|nr:cold shock domain-containing protein [bacterium]
MKKGVVKFYNDAESYGYITDSETNMDYIYHDSGLLDQVFEGDAVIFDLQETTKGQEAVNVKLDRE